MMISSKIPLFSKRIYHRYSSSIKPYDFDIIISGGSIVGASLASSLLHSCQGGLKICIIDNMKSAPILSSCLHRSVPESRTYALSPSSIDFLDHHIHAYKMIHTRAQPYKTMQIWEGNGPGMIRFHADEMNIKQLGCIAEDSMILASIYDVISSHSHASTVHMMFGSSITSCKVDSIGDNGYDGVEVTVSGASNQTLTARLLIGADGANSTVRKQANISSYGWTYGQEAIVATVKVHHHPDKMMHDNNKMMHDDDKMMHDDMMMNDDDGMTAYQRYLPSGPIALLPLPNGYRSVVWSMPTSEAKIIKSLSPENFIAALNHALSSSSSSSSSYTSSSTTTTSSYDRIKSSFDDIIASHLIIDPKRCPPMISSLAASSSSSLLSFPLQFQQASSYTSSRIALIGDAAHSIHPQAGQGLNLGIADVRCLSSIIHDAYHNGQDYGDISCLQPYHDHRYKANLMMMSTVDIINRIFTDKYHHHHHHDHHHHDRKKHDAGVDMDLLSSVKRSMRSVGMVGIHAFPQIKNRIARFATGLDT